jgi:hypothetical protein
LLITCVYIILYILSIHMLLDILYCILCYLLYRRLGGESNWEVVSFHSFVRACARSGGKVKLGPDSGGLSLFPVWLRSFSLSLQREIIEINVK